MDYVRIHHPGSKNARRRHVAIVTADWRHTRRSEAGRSWCTFLVLIVWQQVYERQGRYFTGD